MGEYFDWVNNINKNLVRKREREVFKYNNSIYDQN